MEPGDRWFLLLLLVINGVHSYSWKGYEQLRRKHIAFDRESLMYPSVRFRENVPLKPSLGLSARQQALTQGDAKTKTMQDVVVFPEQLIHSRGNFIGTPPRCEGSTFCEDVPEGYPEHVINEAIRRDEKLVNYANVDKVYTISGRMDVTDEEPLCVAHERLVYPKSAENSNNEWMFVVNHGNFTQGVRIETCQQEGTTCKVIDGFAAGYVTSCKQRYIYRQLSAVAPNGSLVREFFRFPASCCCHVQFTGE